VKRGSPWIIVGDDTRTRVRPGRSEPRHPHAATTLPRRCEDAGARTAKRRNEEGTQQAAPRHATTQPTRGSDPNAPTTPYGRVPAMIIPMRLRAGAAIPGRLSTHPLCPPIAGHGGPAGVHNRPQRRTRLPPAAPTAKSPAQGRIPVESHLRSSTEPLKRSVIRGLSARPGRDWICPEGATGFGRSPETGVAPLGG
jgi:hypothetical protein